LADRARYPLRAFGLVELGIGISALAIPGALGIVERFYVTLHGDGPVLTDDSPLLEYHRSIRDTGPPVDLSSLRGDVTRHLNP
jgi:hypothetical protein